MMCHREKSWNLSYVKGHYCIVGKGRVVGYEKRASGVLSEKCYVICGQMYMVNNIQICKEHLKLVNDKQLYLILE